MVIEHVSIPTLESLIYSDSFRRFGYNKKTLIKNLDSLINYANLTKDIDPSLVMKPEIEEVEEFSDNEELIHEKDVFGFYLTHHPTTNYYSDNKDAVRINEVNKFFNKNVNVLVLIDKVKVINTKKGDKMAFLSGSDETGSIDITLFPTTYKLYSDISKGDILKINGKVEKRFDEYKLTANKIDYLNGEDYEKE